MKTMKTMRTTTALTLAAVLLLVPGCAIFDANAPMEQRVAQLKAGAYAAASIGTTAAIEYKPATRPAFQAAVAALRPMVVAKEISGAQLRVVLASLPVGELRGATILIAIESGTMFFDAITGKPIDLTEAPLVLAAAEGILAGMESGLKATGPTVP